MEICGHYKEVWNRSETVFVDYSTTTLYYKVLLCTTPYYKVLHQYYSSTVPYYKVLLQYYSVLESTTPYYKVLF